MLVDILIIVFAVSAIFRGREIGFVRQAGSTIGFVTGLFLGAWLQPYIVPLAHAPTSRSLLAAMTVVGCAMLLLVLGEYIGLRLKHSQLITRHNKYDNWAGSVLSVASVLFSAWLLAAAFASIPVASVQSELRQSQIVDELDHVLPPAPGLIASLGHLINPNGFPDVFLGHEPRPKNKVSIAPSGSLRQAVLDDADGVVKIAGTGCGGIVEGSGFIIGNDLVATNAHVVAGVHHPYVQDAVGSHSATTVWFDPNLDFAILRVVDLTGPVLKLNPDTVEAQTQAAVLGYPGGGDFTVGAAAVLDEFTARGRDIYNRGATDRDVYELQANIVPGNSGGPLIAADGSVIGVVFAASTSYDQVGYALTSPKILSEVNQAKTHTTTVSTGQCAD